jgi:hypothetical protein
MATPSRRFASRYEDIFRALGNYIDVNTFTDVTIVETGEGFLIKGKVVREQGAGPVTESQTYLFTNEDLDDILEAAYGRRRQ